MAHPAERSDHLASRVDQNCPAAHRRSHYNRCLQHKDRGHRIHCRSRIGSYPHKRHYRLDHRDSKAVDRRSADEPCYRGVPEYRSQLPYQRHVGQQLRQSHRARVQRPATQALRPHDRILILRRISLALGARLDPRRRFQDPRPVRRHNR